MSVKARRHARIRELVASRSLHSQEELASLLARVGLAATQATLSRDLRELGVLKGPDGYRLPERALDRSAPSASAASATVPAMRKGPSGSSGSSGSSGAAPAVAPALARALRSFLMLARPAASLVVLRTGPGQASALALELDRSPPRGALGTVAGDDTIFVASDGTSAARRLAKLLEGASRA